MLLGAWRGSRLSVIDSLRSTARGGHGICERDGAEGLTGTLNITDVFIGLFMLALACAVRDPRVGSRLSGALVTRHMLRITIPSVLILAIGTQVVFGGL
jgi:hypothetical protein